jgi:hypothetical protein
MDFSSSTGSEPLFDRRYRSLQLNSTNPRYAGGKKRQITLVSLSRYHLSSFILIGYRKKSQPARQRRDAPC